MFSFCDVEHFAVDRDQYAPVTFGAVEFAQLLNGEVPLLHFRQHRVLLLLLLRLVAFHEDLHQEERDDGYQGAVQQHFGPETRAVQVLQRVVRRRRALRHAVVVERHGNTGGGWTFVADRAVRIPGDGRERREKRKRKNAKGLSRRRLRRADFRGDGGHTQPAIPRGDGVVITGYDVWRS